MLDHFTIFTKTGLVLYSRSFTPQIPPSTTGSSSHPIDSLVVQAFLQDDVSSSTFQRESYTIRYAFANDVECVFVAVHQRILQLAYVEQLLETVKHDFLQRFRPFLVALSRESQPAPSSSTIQDGGLGSDSLKKLQRDYQAAYPAWDQQFAQTLRTLERSAAQSKRKGPGGGGVAGTSMARAASSNSVAALADNEAGSVEASGGEETPRQNGGSKDVAKNVEALRNRLKKAEISGAGKKGKKGGSNKESPAGSGTESAPGTPTGKKSKGPAKEMRRWDGATVSDKDMAALDFSGGGVGTGAAAAATAASARGNGDEKGSLSGWIDEKSMGKRRDGMYDLADVDDAQDEDDEEDEDDDEDEADAGTGSKGAGAGFLSRFASLGAASSSSSSQANGGSSSGGFFSRLTGNRPLTAQDLAPALSAMQSHLQSKNVAADVASKLCQSVSSSLVGKQLGNFSSIKSEVKKALEDSITRILTPKTSTDILLEISSKKQRSALARQQQGAVDPYSLCFVGVNGVGKSTNLAKVCFWLLQNKLRVLIAACDTFRSGAVEQLRVHVRNLGQLEVDGQRVADGVEEPDGTVRNKIELYERGYGKDAAGIAKDALGYAKTNGFDVVLIDTAGRMQDNEPLMRALAKLVAVNDPDKIIFVGEALVGNEAVDQLTKFDRSLKDFSGVSRPRGLDGMLLTKFDTSESLSLSLVP